MKSREQYDIKGNKAVKSSTPLRRRREFSKAPAQVGIAGSAAVRARVPEFCGKSTSLNNVMMDYR